MGRGDTSLASHEYDSYLANKVKDGNRSAARELAQRQAEKRSAHKPDGTGYHFGIADHPVRVERPEELRKVLDKHGLMLEVDVKKDLTLGRRK